MLIDRSQSCLLVVDAQERLLPSIHGAERLLANCARLLDAAAELKVPTLLTEHYPQGLGPTAAALRERASPAAFVSKIHFSAVREGCLAGRDEYKESQQLVVCGAETHVCVLQTVLDLRQSGKDVFVVADAVGSRTAENKDLALQRMLQNGVQIVSTEMVLFEWLERAGTEQFRTILRKLIR